MKVSTWLCLIVALMLAGCAVSSSPSPATTRYTLAAPTSGESGHHPKQTSTARTGKTIRIAAVAVPPWLDSTHMDYRLSYRSDGAIAAYSDSRWAATPAVMIGRLLKNRLLTDNRWQAVLGPHDAGAGADYVLHVDLTDFEQRFSSPSQSAGVLHAVATLVDTHTSAVVAQRRFAFRVAAPAPNAQGGVKGLSRASAKFTRAVEQWLDRRADTT